MRKMITVLLASTAMFAGHAAIAADASYKAETTIKKDDDGSYKKDTIVESKDASGKVATEVTVDREVDSDGDVEKTTEVKKTTDPKGLWNKQTDKTKQTTEVKDGHASTETERTVNGKTVAEHKSSY